MKTEYWYYLLGAGVLLYLYMAQTGSNPFQSNNTLSVPPDGSINDVNNGILGNFNVIGGLFTSPLQA